MTDLTRATRSFFAVPDSTSSSRVIAWWEARRLPFNIFVGLYGVICFFVYFWAVATSGTLAPGEDVIEPMAIPLLAIVSPIVVNICYTLGWLVDAPVRKCLPSLSPRFSVALLIAGIALSILLISFPAAIWLVFRVLQVLNLV
jgi:hypothetical protein